MKTIDYEELKKRAIKSFQETMLNSTPISTVMSMTAIFAEGYTRAQEDFKRELLIIIRQGREGGLKK